VRQHRRELAALGLIRQHGWRNGQRVWVIAELDDVSEIGRRYLALVACGREEEAEELVREAMVTYPAHSLVG